MMCAMWSVLNLQSLQSCMLSCLVKGEERMGTKAKFGELSSGEWEAVYLEFDGFKMAK